MIWDFYDGVREGIANFEGQPHYFSCVLEEGTGKYTEKFELKRIDNETFKLALEQWAIYEAWETDYHSGNAPLSTHPGGGGVDARYDELEPILKGKISGAPVVAQVYADFRKGEVVWSQQLWARSGLPAGDKAANETASKEEAEEIKGKLEAAGAEVELK